MLQTKKIRVAIAGTGYFSRFQYRAWKRLNDVDLVAVCNRTVERAEKLAREYDIPAVFEDLETMLRNAKPTLLDVITPPETHLEAIKRAAANGVDLICQKPFCRNLAEAEEAISIATNAGIRVVVHENFRFQPWYGQIKKNLGDGHIGRVFQATFRLRPGDGQGKDAYLDRQPYFQQMPRFLVHETAIHLIDVFRYLFGEAHSVYASLRRLNPAIAGEDAGLIVLDMKDGVQAILDGNRLSDHQAQNRRLTMGELLIEGTKGVLRLDGDARIFFRNHGSNEEREISYTWQNLDFGGDCVYETQRHIVGAMLDKHPFVNTASEYLTNIRIEEAAYASSAEGRKIDLQSFQNADDSPTRG